MFYSGKYVLFGEKWLYSWQTGCLWAKVVVLGRKMVVFGHCGCIRRNVVVFLQNGCVRAKWLYSSKVVVFLQKWLYFGNTCLNSGKSCCFRVKVVVF